MKNFRKILALVLAVVMTVSTLTVAFAAEKTSGEKLKALGLVVGNETGDLMEDKELTRAEAAQILVNVMGWKLEPVSSYTFDDDAKWAKPAAATLAKNRITSGVGNNKFGGELMIDELQVYAWAYAALTGSQEKAWENHQLLTQILPADKVAAVVATKNTPAKRSQVFDGMVTILTKVGDDGLTQLDKLVAAKKVTEAQVVAAGLKTALTLKIESVDAVKVNVLEVKFSKPVDTADITIAVTRATTSVPGTVAWNADKTVATITTTANMINGTHTVTATSKADATLKVTGTVEVTSQKVASIVILNNTALTGKSGVVDNNRAYVYYDVLDQYGESIRRTTDIQWSTSAKLIGTPSRTTGLITLGRPEGDTRAFTYNEQIYLTGVSAKTSMTVNETLTVGQTQALNSVKIAGYVKKGTNEIVKTLPAGFKADTYYMVYTAVDQMGNPLASTLANPVANSDISFISDNILVVKELRGENDNIIVDGVQYYGVFVQPGIQVDKGGEVNITAIANKTGNKTVINTAVGENQILTTFTLGTPTDIIADGESVVIPFTALDQNGNDIKNFVTLARNETFNKLSFTPSTGTLVLKEKADGTAELKFTDSAAPEWTDSQTTDGIARTASLTVVVVGGTGSNALLSIQDKARPEGIKSATVPAVVVERDSFELKETKLAYTDQYGRDLSAANATAFFAASNLGDGTTNSLNGSEFAGYEFAIRATYLGDAGLFNENHNPGTFGDIVDGVKKANDDVLENKEDLFIRNGETVTITSNPNTVATAKSGLNFKFDIVKYKANGADGVAANDDDKFVSAQSVSPARNVAFTVVDITKVTGFEVKDLNKVYMNTAKSNDLTGDVGTVALSATAGSLISDTLEAAGNANILATYKQTVKVKGTYNGNSVDVPNAYLEVSGTKLKLSDKVTIDGVDDTKVKWSDLYDATTARYSRKDTTDTLVAKINNLDDVGVLDTASKVVTISDAAPVLTTINGADTWDISAKNTEIENTTINGRFTDHLLYTYKDQYGVTVAAPTLTYKIASIVESADGYAANNFKVTGNDTGAIAVTGAERGDTFILTIKAVKDGVTITKEIKVTVGADTMAKIDGSTNNYLDDLIGDGLSNGPTKPGVLEEQRKAGLN